MKLKVGLLQINSVYFHHYFILILVNVAVYDLSLINNININ